MARHHCWHPDCTVILNTHKCTCREHGSLDRPRCATPDCQGFACRDSPHCRHCGGLQLPPPPKEELEALLKVHREPAIMIHYHTTYKVLRRWMIHHGLQGRIGGNVTKPNPYSKAELRQLIRTVSLREIARRHRVSTTTATRWLDGHGLKVPRRPGQSPVPYQVRRRPEREKRARHEQRTRELITVLAPDQVERLLTGVGHR